MPRFGSMSKKRYQEINDLLKTKYGIKEETAKEILGDICNIVNYDPEQNTYTPEKGQLHSAWRAKKAEELGVTISSIASGRYKKTT